MTAFVASVGHHACSIRGCQVLIGLLSQETTDFEGKFYQLTAARNYTEIADWAAALAAEGLDLAIIYLPPPHTPAVLEPLAEALRDSGLAA